MNISEHPDRKNRILIVSIIMILVGLILILLAVNSTESWGRFSEPWRSLLQAVGISLLSSNLIALIYSYFIRSAFLKEIETTLRQTSSEIEEIRKSGIVKVHKKFPTADVLTGIANAEREVRILTSWLDHALDISDRIIEASKNAKNKKNILNVKILILDPERENVAQQRENEIFIQRDVPKGDGVKHNIDTCLGKLESSFKLENSSEKAKISSLNVEIKKYCVTPVLLMYLYDDRIIYSPMLKGRVTMFGPQTEILGNKTPLYENLVEQFDIIWKLDSSITCYNSTKTSS